MNEYKSASKQIKDLSEATTVNNDDIIMLQTIDGSCKKVRKEVLLKDSDSNTMTDEEYEELEKNIFGGTQ